MKNINQSPVVGLKPQFIVDNKGKKTAVILDIKTYEELVEEIEDLYLGMLASQALSQATEEDLIPHEMVKKRTKKAKK